MVQSVLVKLVRSKLQCFFLVVILAQSILQFRRAHHLVENESIDFPGIPTSTESSSNATITKFKHRSIQRDKNRKLLRNELKGFVTGNKKDSHNFVSTKIDWTSHRFVPEKNSSLQGSSISSGEEMQEESIPFIVSTRKEWNAAKNIQNPRPRRRGSKILGRKTRVIYGIMTYDSDSERKRRGLIRSTFLKYFKSHMNRTIVSDEEYEEKKDWICSLNDLDRGVLEEPEKCRMAYAFVQGANPNGPSMLLTFNETYPISLPAPRVTTVKEKRDHLDTVYLNIQENGKFGKSPTWFRYAIDVLERHGWLEDFDYIFKSDTDNLLYTPNFFRYMDRRLPKKKKQLVYGGQPLDYKKCGGDKHDHCKDMVGPYFMQGGCYFLSTELARFISDETSFDHQAVKLPHEDMTTGNFVYSHPHTEQIKIVKIKRKGEIIRKHPVKEDRKYKFRWKLMLGKEQCRRTNCTKETNEDELD